MKESSVSGSRRTMSPTPIMLSRSEVFTSMLAASSPPLKERIHREINTLHI